MLEILQNSSNVSFQEREEEIFQLPCRVADAVRLKGVFNFLGDVKAISTGINYVLARVGAQVHYIPMFPAIPFGIGFPHNIVVCPI
jgi:hypothetical protein